MSRLRDRTRNHRYGHRHSGSGADIREHTLELFKKHCALIGISAGLTNTSRRTVLKAAGESPAALISAPPLPPLPPPAHAAAQSPSDTACSASRTGPPPASHTGPEYRSPPPPAACPPKASPRTAPAPPAC